MASSMVHAWSDAFRTKVSKLVSTPRGKGGKEEKPTEEFFIGDREAPPKGTVADDGEDNYQEARTLAARTLAVEYDEQGARFKEWRVVCAESTLEYYPDFPVSGPCSAVDVCKHMLRHGGTPKLWLQQWRNDKGITQRDRVYHEVSALVEIVYQAGCYDALNMGASAAIKVVMRRLLSIIEAHAHNPQAPDWGNAR